MIWVKEGRIADLIVVNMMNTLSVVMAGFLRSGRKLLPWVGIALFGILVAAGTPSIPDRLPTASHAFEVAAVDPQGPSIPCNTDGGQTDHSGCIAGHCAPGPAIVANVAPASMASTRLSSPLAAALLLGYAAPPLFHPPKLSIHA